MQNDDVIWQIINHQFCSFKSKIARERTFCQNPYNVTGLCIRSACPLANSRYATIREEEGDCYLFIKTIERAHTPKNLWEKIKLPSNYTKALELVSAELEHFPKYLVHRNKQRLTKIHQMLIRMRKLKLKHMPKLVTTNTKIEQREKGKERKALAAAQLDRAIEKELLERLRQATEGEIFNYPEKQYSRVLNKATSKFQTESGEVEDPDLEDEEENEAEEGEMEMEGEEEGEDQEMEQEEEDDESETKEYNVEYIEDFEESDDEDADGEDMEDQSFAGSLSTHGSAGRRSVTSASSSAHVPLKSALRSASADASKKRKLAFEGTSTKPSSSKAAAAAMVDTKKRNPHKARVEVEYELEEEGERVPAQLRILAAQAAAANSKGASSGASRARPVLRR